MDSLQHSVRKETLLVECDSIECALALRPRLADFNVSHLVPVVERVLSEAAISGRQIRIERLEVNLGHIQLSEFEAVAAERLYRELKEAVEQALSSPFNSTDRPEAVSHIELLEWYLLRGTLPFWGPSAAAFSVEASFAELARQNPAELARLVRRAGTNDRALRRIVEQLSPGELRRLVAVLDPEHAALILAYVIDLREVQREEPLVRVAESEFDRLLWLLVLVYLMREAGSQFNRKMFVASLIAGFSAQAGMDYEDVLAMLGLGLQRTLLRRSLPSSLPATIAELLRDSGLRNDTPTHTSGDTEETAPENWSLAALAESDPEALARLVRRYGSDPGWLERLVSVLDEKALVRLIGLLEPDQAAMIVAFLFDVKEVHREEPVLAGDPGRFDRLLWSIALAYLVRESGSQFNRKAFLLDLVQRLAETEKLDFAGVFATFRLGLGRVASRTPLKSSLPAILAGLLEDLGRQTSGEPGRYELVEMLRGYLEHGVLPWTAILRDPSLTPERALSRLPDLPFSLIEMVLSHGGAGKGDAGKRLQMVLAAVRRMPLEDVRRLLSRILPSIDEPGSPIAGAFQDATRNMADLRTFYAHLVAAVLGGEPLDFEQFQEEAKGGAVNPTPRENPDPRDPKAIKAAIAAGLASGSTSSGEEPEVPSLVAALIRQDAVGARRFLRTISDRPVLRDALVRFCSPEDFDAILGLLAGANAPGLRSLLSVLLQLPVTERPSPESLYSIALSETLHWDPMQPMAEGLFERILHTVFPSGPPSRIREALATANPDAARWAPPVPRQPLSAERILDLLLAQSNEPNHAEDVLIQALEQRLEECSAADAGVRALLTDPQKRTRLPRILPQSTFARLVKFLEPARSRELLQAAELLASAWSLAVPGNQSAATREVVWGALLELLAESRPSVDRLAAKAFARFSASASPQATIGFRKHSERLAVDAGLATLGQAMKRQAMKPQPEKPHAASAPQDPRETGQPLFIANAGLVLTSPFLPHLFQTFDMLQKDEKGRGQWRDRHAASRAIHLLQYLVDERTSASEPLLVLNKILCGLPTATPVERKIEPTAEEREICDKLLQAMLANWTVLSNSSVAALRETFLQREGKLERDGDKWTLRVQRKTVDVLVDQIPWSFSLIFHNWMPEPVHVTW